MSLERRTIAAAVDPQGRAGRILGILAFAVLFLHWTFIVSFIVPRLGSLRFLRLHYTAALGVDWIDAWWRIFTFPAIGAAVFFVNAWLGAALSRMNRPLGVLVLAATVAVEALLAAGGIMATLLNS